MIDLKKLVLLQQNLQLSLAGNANLLSMDDGFRATFSCDCSGSCKGTFENMCDRTKLSCKYSFAK